MDKLTQAQWCENLLNDDFFRKVIEDLKTQQIGVIMGSNPYDVDVREDAYRHIRTIDLIVGHLQGIAAEKQIREKKWKIL
jgi:hypothetical protein